MENYGGIVQARAQSLVTVSLLSAMDSPIGAWLWHLEKMLERGRSLSSFRSITRRVLPAAIAVVAFGCGSSGDNMGGTGNDYNFNGSGGAGASAGAGTGASVGTGSTGSSGGQGSTTCGNGVQDQGEACDGVVPAGMTCASYTSNALPNGSLSCNACQIDSSGCTTSGGIGTGTGGSGTGGFTGAGGGFGAGGRGP